MAKKPVTKVLSLALDLIQIACALVVIVVTSWRLLKIDRDGLDFQSTCLLDGSGRDGTFTGTQFCAYVIVVGGISLIFNAIVGCARNIFRCITAGACGASRLISIAGDTILTIWWGVAFYFVVRRGVAANNADWPERAARDGVIAATFGAMAAYAADIIVGFFTFA
ncbi:hypothetical protein FGB62_64g144 [Gracilaria domingensis]|nr:hypothetical protein FGB62_64g144 [Gracilaria domingensis]